MKGPRPILDVDQLNLWIGRDRVHAVRDLSFAVGREEILGLAGVSGAGKTQAAAGLVGLAGGGSPVVATGRVTFEGEAVDAADHRGLSRFRGSGISMVTQESMASITPVRRIGDLLFETLEKVGGGGSPGATAELLQEVGFKEPESVLNSYAHQLSGGMRQRVSFALALAANPKMLIADEPTTALDLRLQVSIMRLLARLRRTRGMTILVITHDLSVIAQLTDRTMILNDGRLIEVGATRELFASPREAYTSKLLERNRSRREPLDSR